MTEETKQRHSGRRREREPGTYQRVTLEFPVELWHIIGERSKNRTQWLIDAAQEKIEKDEPLGRASARLALVLV